MYSLKSLRTIAAGGVTIALLATAAGPHRTTQPETPATVFTVTSGHGDWEDRNKGDGICLACIETHPTTGECLQSACTLRAAIQEANALGGAHEVEFAVDTVRWGTVMPFVEGPLTIDGRLGTSSRVVFEGSDQAVIESTGLRFRGTGGSVVRNVEILGFAVGIRYQDSDGHRVENAYIHHNNAEGLYFKNSGGNVVGGDESGGSLGPGNEIAHNATYGVSIDGGSGGNVIQGNYVHDNIAGIWFRNAGANQVGGLTPTPGTRLGNVISGNSSDGIMLMGQACGASVMEGNLVGPDPEGGPANDGHGLRIDAGCAEGTRIGGDAPESRNVVSGNGGIGIYVLGGSGLVIRSNYIGVDASGAVAMGNRTGISIGGDGHQIGAEGAGNVVSGNTEHGVEIRSTSSAPSAGVEVRGNRIGTDAAGAIAIENGRNGVLGRGEGHRVLDNLISGNGGDGISFSGIAGFAPTSNILIDGNLVGTAADGEVPLGNEGNGITISTADDPTITNNVVSANVRSGVVLSNTAGGRVWSNFVGTDRTATTVIGNGRDGILVSGGSENYIARPIGSDSDVPNIIAGNGLNGISLSLGQETGHIVAGNFVGTNPAGDALGNAGAGIYVSGATRNLIGSRLSPVGRNTIAHNTGDGVFILSGRRNEIVGNSIFLNGGIGINLDEDGSPATIDGATPNDEGDLDDGANDLQNFPAIASSTYDPDADATRIRGSLRSMPQQTYRVEIFAGYDWLTSLEVTTDADGTGPFDVTVDGEQLEVSATATDAEGNTSEFSFSGLAVNAPSDEDDLNPGDGTCDTGLPPVAGSPHCTLRAAIQETNALPGPDEILFQIPGSPPHRIVLPRVLPPVTDPVTIDGASQPGYDGRPIIEVAGNGIDYGIHITAGASTLRGLVINDFEGAGVWIEGAGGSRVEGSYIGLDVSGGERKGNRWGILIERSSDNVIGGAGQGEGNVLSGNSDVGIHVTGGSGNIISGNLIGTDAAGQCTLDDAGLCPIGNGGDGIQLENANGSSIGGTLSGAHNVISGNRGYGIRVTGSDAAEESVVGNLIGMDVTETERIANGEGGILVDRGASGVYIGGFGEGESNVIYGGIRIDGPTTKRVRIERNILEVPAVWMDGADFRLPIRMEDGGAACNPWTGGSGPNAGVAPPRILKLTTGVVEGIAPGPGRVEIYRVMASGHGRGRYFARRVEPVARAETDAAGAFSVAVSLPETDVVAAVFTDLDGNSSELTQLRRPVVFVPGVGGSWLEGADGTALWLPGGATAIGQNQNLARMAFNPNGTSAETVTADEIVEKLLGLSIAYGPGLDYLQANGYNGHPTNEQPSTLDLWRYAFDWRESPSSLAGGLAVLIDRITGDEAEVAHACEVDLLAHSYGGLVASYYVRTEERARDAVHRFVTVGTPYLGTPQAAAAHTKGYIFGLESTRAYGDIFLQGLLVHWGSMINMARNLWVAYSLMPSRRYWDAGGSWYLMDLNGRILEDHNTTFRFLANPKFDSRNRPLGLNRNSNVWRHELNEVHDRIEDWRDWSGPPQVFRAVGNLRFATTGAWRIGSLTFKRVLRRQTGLDMARIETDDSGTHWQYREALAPVPDAGDGTVNLISATLGRDASSIGGIDFSGVDSSPWIEEFAYFPCDHVTLVEPKCVSPSGERSLDHVIRILESGYTAFPEPAGKRGFAPSEDADHELFYVSSDAPIGVHVEDPEGLHTGPVHPDSLHVIEYGVPNVSYWSGMLGVTLVLPRGEALTLTVDAADTTTSIQIARVIAAPGETPRHILFPVVEVEEGGSIGWSPADAALSIDSDGNGHFEGTLEPSAELVSDQVAPAIPVPEPLLVQTYAYVSDAEDRSATLRIPDVPGALWNWTATETADWVSLSSASGSAPADVEITFSSAALPAGSHSSSIALTLQYGDFETTHEVGIRLDVLDAPALSHIEVSPSFVTLRPGESQQFLAAGFDESDQPLSFTAAWTAAGGTIDESGFFVAGEYNGRYLVAAEASGADVQGSAIVEIEGGLAVAAEEDSMEPPEDFALLANYPNPFNPTTTIPFELPKASHVTLSVYDVLGRQVATLVDGTFKPGRYSTIFDAGSLPSGAYFYRLEADDVSTVGTMLLVK